MGLKGQLNSFVQSFQEGGKFNKTSFLEYLKNYSNAPKYSYGDIPKSKEGIEEWAQELGVSTKGKDLNTQDGLNAFAGELQKEALSKYRNVVNHYTIKKPFTKKDIDDAISLGLVDKNFFSSKGVKFGKDGKALRGTLESGMNLQDALKISEDLDVILNKDENKDKKAKFEEAFNDNKWYYRRPIIKTISFDNNEERDDFVKDYTDIGNGTYYSNKTGLYFNTDVKPEEVIDNQVLDSTDEHKLKNFKNKFLGMPLIEPDQRINLDTGVDVGYLGRVEAPNFRKVNVSAEPHVSANYSSAMQALNSLKDANGMTGNALTASILGQTQQANNQAIGQVGAQNQNIDSQIERLNEQAVGQADQMNLQLATNYNNQWLQGDANLDAINRTLQKFNTDVDVQRYTNAKTREYIKSVLGVDVANGMVMSDDMDTNLEDKLKYFNAMQNAGLPQPVVKKEKGGYIKEFIKNYLNED